MAGIFFALLSCLPASAFAQTCSWGNSVGSAPAAAYLRSYGDLFYAPGRIAIDGSGKIYSTDPQSGQVFVRDKYGRLVGSVGGLAKPLGITVDNAGRIYIGEQGEGRVSVFDDQWNFLMFVGQGNGEFVIPNYIALDSQSGWIFVSDSGADTIKVYSAANGSFLTFYGTRGNGPGQFNFPTGLYFSPSGELFVADQNNDRIQVLDRNGNFLRCIGASGGMSFATKFGRIQGLAGDSLGRLYVADTFQGYVQVLDSAGNALSTIGSFGDGAGQLRTPMSVAIDPSNRLFVSSVNNSRLEIFGLDGYADPQIIPAVVTIEPASINRDRRRQIVTAYIEMRDYPLDEVDVSTITINDLVVVASSVSIGDENGNQTPDLALKFDAREVAAQLPDGQAVILLSGSFRDGRIFEGGAKVKITSKDGLPPQRIPIAADRGPAEGETQFPPSSGQASGLRVEGNKSTNGVSQLLTSSGTATGLSAGQPKSAGGGSQPSPSQGYLQVLDSAGYVPSTIGTLGDGAERLRTAASLASDPHNRQVVPSLENSRLEVIGQKTDAGPKIIPAVVTIQPSGSQGSSENNIISAYIEIRSYPPDEIDVSRITVNGVPVVVLSTSTGDQDGNRFPDLEVRFDARDVIAQLPDGDAVIRLKGLFKDGRVFEGAAKVKVVSTGQRTAEVEGSAKEESLQSRSAGDFSELPAEDRQSAKGEAQ